MRVSFLLAALCITAVSFAPASAAERLRALIVDGQNNHANWPHTTRMMKRYLEDSGLFTVEVATHAPTGEDPTFAPAFDTYAVVVSNFGHGASPWPAETKSAFEEYVRGGGGFVVAHGKGRVFHTPMGHGNDSQECVGFFTTLSRGAEWAATGTVRLPVPADFPGAASPSSRPFTK
ncbi:MAG: ThuA domain-containing protein [Planctomycetia bacterium]